MRAIRAMRYLLTAPSPAYRVGPGLFALEAAFVRHLRDLRDALEGRAQLILAMPAMSAETYAAQRASMVVVDEQAERMRLETLYEEGAGKLRFALGAPSLWARAWRLVTEADLIHTNFCYDLYRPVGATFALLGRIQRKPVLAVEDIDRRQDAVMNKRTGRWGWRNYLACRYVYDPVRSALYRAYVRGVDLMLFKELGQVKDYGNGAPHVRLFLDPNFSAQDVVDDAFVEEKIRALRSDRPLRALYAGRLVAYKGVDKMLEAVARARHTGAPVTLSVMGSGEEAAALRAVSHRLGIDDAVTWLEPRPYGAPFFEVVRAHDVFLACPLSGDTPRTAWDALANGVPLVAFDTPFYRSMAEVSHAVTLSPWLDVDAFASTLAALARDREGLARQITAAVRVARENTAERWLATRNAWVSELMSKSR